MDSNHFWKRILVPDWNQNSDNLQYNTLGRWDERLIAQATDVQNIFFFKISFQKSFQFIFLFL